MRAAVQIRETFRFRICSLKFLATCEFLLFLSFVRSCLCSLCACRVVFVSIRPLDTYARMPVCVCTLLLSSATVFVTRTFVWNISSWLSSIRFDRSHPFLSLVFSLIYSPTLTLSLSHFPRPSARVVKTIHRSPPLSIHTCTLPIYQSITEYIL